MVYQMMFVVHVNDIEAMWSAVAVEKQQVDNLCPCP